MCSHGSDRGHNVVGVGWVDLLRSVESCCSCLRLLYLESSTCQLVFVGDFLFKHFLTGKFSILLHVYWVYCIVSITGQYIFHMRYVLLTSSAQAFLFSMRDSLNESSLIYLSPVKISLCDINHTCIIHI